MANPIERPCESCGLLNDRTRAKSCRVCAKEAKRLYMVEYDRGRKQQKADYCRKKKYDLDPDGYRLMQEACDGRCQICGLPPAAGASLNVDHDHVTGEIRGLLCTDCNLGLGRFRDDVGRLNSAAGYIKSTRGSSETGGKVPQVTNETDRKEKTQHGNVTR